jgi:hypothetical protein
LKDNICQFISPLSSSEFRWHRLLHKLDQSRRAVQWLALPEVPVETLMDAPQEIGCWVHQASCGHRPWRNAADEGVTWSELNSTLAIEGCPCLPSAVHWYLHTQSDIFRQYQRPEWQRMRAYWGEKNPWDLHTPVKHSTKVAIYTT